MSKDVSKANIIYSDFDWENDKEQSLPDIRKDFMDAVDNCMDNNGNSSFCVLVKNRIGYMDDEGNYDSPEAETNMVNVFGTVIVVREW